jgi:hypothetical protein
MAWRHLLGLILAQISLFAAQSPVKTKISGRDRGDHQDYSHSFWIIKSTTKFAESKINARLIRRGSPSAATQVGYRIVRASTNTSKQSVHDLFFQQLLRIRLLHAPSQLILR